MRILIILSTILVLASCKPDKERATLYRNVTTSSGISFRNDLTITEQVNPYTFRSFYNGGGVAIGDINNDGLLDIYFSGNQVDNSLYLNAGNMTFKDITKTAGVSCSGSWSTGVTFVDINADGFLDIYVCKSGSPDGPHRNNELFISNQDLTFTERSAEYGLDIVGLSVQASFFDYDKDGDLDCYLLTNSLKSIGQYDLVKDQRTIPDPGGNKFFINENGKYRDCSSEAGIYRSSIGFGLGITLGDFNNDSWTDIFVSNDFFERDYLYINNHKGAFIESLTEYFQSISMGSMGADCADLDNDGDAELFVTEMLPDSLSRRKTKTVYESWNKYELNVQNGYYHQQPRNVLQKKIGKDTYAEVGRMAGVSASEWSWGTLLFDMDNDGLRDIFVANGIYKDLLDRDYLTYTGAEENVRKIIKAEKNAIIKLIELMPSSSFPNYAFRNQGLLHFKNASSDWGLDDPMYSCGSAYADLDNDGDLDLVVNNVNAAAAIYQNNSDSSRYKSISVTLSCRGGNTQCVGSRVTAYANGEVRVADNFVTRGFQSSVQPRMHIGLGTAINRVDSLLIQWPEGDCTVLRNVQVNKHFNMLKERVDKSIASQVVKFPGNSFSLTLVEDQLFRHQGSGLVDFNRDRLLPLMYSNETPFLAKVDVDKDGMDEVYVGGGKGQPGTFLQYQEGGFRVSSKTGIESGISEETKGAFFDVDGDGDLDFYMANGGRFYPKTSNALQDKLFINNGKGSFAEAALSVVNLMSTSVAKPIDFDNDNDFDLLLGERFDPFVYGTSGRGYLLQNNGSGQFTDVTKQYAPDLSTIGMITDASIVDFDNDGWKDIVLVGDWMPITFLRNNRSIFINTSKEMLQANSEGWWHGIESTDFNGDNKPDFVLANQGLNSFFKAGDRVYISDFDKNGSIEQVFCTKEGDKYFPIVDKDEFLSQLPSLKKSLLYYKDYARKSIDELFPQSVLSNASVYQVNLLASVLLLSSPHGYKLTTLPQQAQYSTLYGLLAGDFDNDGIDDLLAGGNQYQVKPQFGRSDASVGWFFKGLMKDGKFSFGPGVALMVKGQIRDIEYLKVKDINYILFAKHDDNLEIYKVNQ